MRGVDREELLALLDTLRAEDVEHRSRLRVMLDGLETDQQVVAKPRLSIGRLIPAPHLT